MSGDEPCSEGVGKVLGRIQAPHPWDRVRQASGLGHALKEHDDF